MINKIIILSGITLLLFSMGMFINSSPIAAESDSLSTDPWFEIVCTC